MKTKNKKKLGLMDTFFLMIEKPEVTMHVGALITFKLPKTGQRKCIDNIVSEYRNVASIRPPFNQKLKYPIFKAGFPCWVDDENFDIDFHVYHQSLPKPGKMEDLLKLVSKLHSQILDRKHPLWQTYLIEGLEGNRLAIYVKIHHAAIDGVGGVRLIPEQFSKNKKSTRVTPWYSDGIKVKKDKESKGTLGQLLSSGPIGQLFSLGKNVKRQAQTIPELMKLYAGWGGDILTGKSKMGIPYKAPKSMFNQPFANHRTIGVKDFDLKDFKAISKSENASINDVYLAVVGGGLRRYLQIENGPAASNTLVALIPFGLEAKNKSRKTNMLSQVLCPLGTQIEDPLERLKKIKATMKEGKERISKVSTASAVNYNFITNGPMALTWLFNVTEKANKLRVPFNLQVSNVPGPPEQRYVNGAEVEAIYPLSLLWDGQGLTLTILGQSDKLHLGLTAAKNVIPDVDYFMQCMDESFIELKNSVNTEKASKK